QQEAYPWEHTETGISCQRHPVLRTNNTPLRSSLFGMAGLVLTTGSGSFAANQSYCDCAKKNVALCMGSISCLFLLNNSNTTHKSSVSSRDLKWVRRMIWQSLQ